MEWITSLPSADFLAALLSIVVIDLVLAGDNAIVIALAARNLPGHLQKKAIVWGTVGAIVVRAAMTMAVVWLLKVPGLLLLGGAALIWIAYKLLAEDESAGEHGPVGATLWAAMRTIVVADAVMGLDNVLAVAGAAHGSFLLVVLGLLISIPLVIWGSSLVLRLVGRFPAIVYLGAGVLAYTAGKMVVTEPLSKAFFTEHPFLTVAIYAVILVVVLWGGHLARREAVAARAGEGAEPGEAVLAEPIRVPSRSN
ncbi:MAG: TerC family protein [Betaproteobacteria bacterium]|nr:TerC family protein [Betaproteobacteria bacterium]